MRVTLLAVLVALTLSTTACDLETTAGQTSSSATPAPGGPKHCDPNPPAMIACKFGDTFSYRVTYDYTGITYSYDVTVSRPKRFTPGPSADLTADALARYDPTATNVYFVVTIKNRSTKDPIKDFYMESQPWYNGNRAATISEPGKEGFGYDEIDIPPGQSVKIKDAWNIKDVKAVRYELSVASSHPNQDKTFTFTF